MSDNLARIEKLEKLPLPRLQLTWRTEAPGQWSCDYELLVPVHKYDIRNNGLNDKVGAGPGYFKVSLGGTQSTSIDPLSYRLFGGAEYPCLDIPFRDGAHAAWDSFQLGFPTYVVYQDGGATYIQHLPSMEPPMLLVSSNR